MNKVIASAFIIIAALVYFKGNKSFGKENKINSIRLKRHVTIGDKYRGGIVAYVLKESDAGYDERAQHGLIVAAEDQTKEIQWYNGIYTAIGATASGFGGGKTNTDSIVANQGEGQYAAKLCADLVIDKYNDWYLPSKDELNLLYLSKDIIGGFGKGEVYWSSTEDGKAFYVWRQGFFSGSQTTNDKKSVFAVRAVRYF